MEGEIVARVERRRMWSAAEKAALLAEVEAEGGRVSVVAKRHRMPRDNHHENRIASPEKLPKRDLLPHINAPQFGYFCGGGDEEGQYGDA